MLMKETASLFPQCLFLPSNLVYIYICVCVYLAEESVIGILNLRNVALMF